jgi:YggT family protein
MSNHTIDLLERWVNAFVLVYTALIFAWIISGMVRLPYNVWTNRIRKFLDDTVSPFVGLFRRFAPRLGPLDLSPLFAFFTLQIAAYIVTQVLDGFRPAG